MTTEPTLRRKFTIFDPKINSNKEWMIEVWPQSGNTVLMKTSWGRVGTRGGSKEKFVTMKQALAKITEQQKEGYEEIDLAAPVSSAAPIATSDPKVLDLVKWIYSEAGEAIASYLAVPVNNLSVAQITKGREKLHEVQSLYNVGSNITHAIVNAVIDYYRAIPTKLPSKINENDLVTTFLTRMVDIESELDQLEAAVSTLVAPGGTQYNSLGANIALVSPGESVYDQLYAYCTKGVDRYQFRLDNIFRVEIPHEREAFKAYGIAIGNVKCLIHATRTYYVRHILKQGMKLPTSGGDRLMFGYGLYHANVTAKSLNYAEKRGYNGPNIMFLSDVALGRHYEAPESMKRIKKPPQGYHSVMGVANQTRTGGWNGSPTLNHDEFIVYDPRQMTIRYLVTFNR